MDTCISLVRTDASNASGNSALQRSVLRSGGDLVAVPIRRVPTGRNEVPKFTAQAALGDPRWRAAFPFPLFSRSSNWDADVRRAKNGTRAICMLGTHGLGDAEKNM